MDSRHIDRHDPHSAVNPPIPVEGAYSPGAALAVARLAKGFTVEGVANLLKLSVAQIHAIEADDYSRLPSAVFVRGFIRNYARLVNLDAEPLLPAKAAPTEHADVHLMHRTPGVVMEPSSYRRLPSLLAGVACVLLGLAYYEFVLNAPPGEPAPSKAVTRIPVEFGLPAATVDGAMTEPAERVVAVAPPASRLDASTEQLVLKKSSEPNSEPARGPIGGRLGEPISDTISGEGLHFVFNGDSWVEVRDRLGRVVYSKSNPSGTESLVRGDPPLSVVVGAASVVKLSYKGSPVDLAMHATADVARLRLE